jgi:hypothetical protein
VSRGVVLALVLVLVLVWLDVVLDDRPRLAQEVEVLVEGDEGLEGALGELERLLPCGFGDFLGAEPAVWAGGGLV